MKGNNSEKLTPGELAGQVLARMGTCTAAMGELNRVRTQMERRGEESLVAFIDETIKILMEVLKKEDK